VASISYRLAGEAPFPEPVEDVRAAVRWVREQASQLALDDTRIALWGSSAGAFLASTAAVLGDRPIGRPIGQSDASSTVSAVVDHYGITDVRTLAADADPHASADLPGLLRAMGYFVRQEGGPTPAILDHVGTSAPPFLIMHGDVDRRVGVDQSRRLHSGLREAGVSSQLVIVPGADHGDPLFEHEMHIDTVVRFLREVWAPEAGT
jgi:acetyl esterase/lipase